MSEQNLVPGARVMVTMKDGGYFEGTVVNVDDDDGNIALEAVLSFGPISNTAQASAVPTSLGKKSILFRRVDLETIQMFETTDTLPSKLSVIGEIQGTDRKKLKPKRSAYLSNKIKNQFESLLKFSALPEEERRKLQQDAQNQDPKIKGVVANGVDLAIGKNESKDKATQDERESQASSEEQGGLLEIGQAESLVYPHHRSNASARSPLIDSRPPHPVNAIVNVVTPQEVNSGDRTRSSSFLNVFSNEKTTGKASRSSSRSASRTTRSGSQKNPNEIDVTKQQTSKNVNQDKEMATISGPTLSQATRQTQVNKVRSRKEQRECSKQHSEMSTDSINSSSSSSTLDRTFQHFTRSVAKKQNNSGAQNTADPGFDLSKRTSTGVRTTAIETQTTSSSASTADPAARGLSKSPPAGGSTAARERSPSIEQTKDRLTNGSREVNGDGAKSSTVAVSQQPQTSGKSKPRILKNERVNIRLDRFRKRQDADVESAAKQASDNIIEHLAKDISIKQSSPLIAEAKESLEPLAKDISIKESSPLIAEAKESDDDPLKRNQAPVKNVKDSSADSPSAVLAVIAATIVAYCDNGDDNGPSNVKTKQSRIETAARPPVTMFARSNRREEMPRHHQLSTIEENDTVDTTSTSIVNSSNTKMKIRHTN